jgi:hypothetical protein
VASSAASRRNITAAKEIKGKVECSTAEADSFKKLLRKLGGEVPQKSIFWFGANRLPDSGSTGFRSTCCGRWVAPVLAETLREGRPVSLQPQEKELAYIAEQ